jgi:hypothetical protein
MVGAAASGADEAGGETFLVVEQNLQEMFGRETLMPRADGKPLRGLDEAAAPVRVFFEIHMSSLSSTLPGQPDFARAAPSRLICFGTNPLRGIDPRHVSGQILVLLDSHTRGNLQSVCRRNLPNS